MTVIDTSQVKIRKHTFNSILKEDLSSPPPNPAQMSLKELSKHYHLEKTTAKLLFTSTYERYLKNSRPLHFSLLEIGVGNGSSLKMWASYFTQGSIYGLDIHPSCAGFCKSFKNIHISIGNPADLAQMPKHFLQDFDLIIETACHIATSSITPFNTLWPKLKSGGLFIIEDPLIELNTPKKLQKPNPLSLKRWFGKYDPPEYVTFLQGKLNDLQTNGEIDFIHLYPQLCIIRKK